MTSADITHRILALGEQDAATGWYDKIFTEETIKMIVRPRGATVLGLSVGYYARYDHTGFCVDIVDQGDEIEDAQGNFYVIKAIQEEWFCDNFSHRVCDLVKREIALQPTALARWHRDSDNVITDPRYRHKVYLDTYLDEDAITLDDGETHANYITCFDTPPYPMLNIFTDKEVDAVFAVSKTDATPLYTSDHHIYAFDERVPITVYAINKTDVTATMLVERGEQEIRHIVTDHPLGSLRGIERTVHEPVDVGCAVIYATTVTVTYRRPNDDYIPTSPKISYGIGWTYEGDRTSGGAEGTWTLATGGSTVTQSVDSENNLRIYITAYVGDAYTVNGTNLGLSTSIYTKIRFRYKTSYSTKAKIVAEFSDGTTQTILHETSSTTWTVGEETFFSGKTLDHIYLYCGDYAGTAYYDFVQVYKNDFVFPNVTNITPPFMIQEANISIPGRSGIINQLLGSGSMELTMTCDLDMEHSDVEWQRSGDYNNFDIFLETIHNEGSNAQNIWYWLDVGDPSMQFKAQLVEMRPSLVGEGNMIDLKWREYRHGTAANENASERFGLSL